MRMKTSELTPLERFRLALWMKRNNIKWPFYKITFVLEVETYSKSTYGIYISDLRGRYKKNITDVENMLSC